MPNVDTVSTVTCYGCNNDFPAHEIIRAGGRSYCSDCYFERFTECSHCGERVASDDCHEYEGETLCPSCYSEVWVCVHCGVSSCEPSDRWSYGSQNYCHDCYHEVFETCRDCGATVRVGHTCSCINNIIKQYAYQPRQLLFRRLPHEYRMPTLQTCYFGIEIEMEVPESQNRNELAKLTKDFKDVYCKEDGSIQYGLEIVTHPMTLGYFKSRAEHWKELLGQLKSKGCRSHQTKTCGLHVHLSRAYIPFIDDDVLKMRLLFWTCRSMVHSISRRERESSYAQYDENKPHAFDSCGGRYRAINTDTGKNTVEIRIFRGSLNYQTIRGSVEMCLAVAQYCREFPRSHFERHARHRNSNLLWQHFMTWAEQKKTFQHFVKLERRKNRCV